VPWPTYLPKDENSPGADCNESSLGKLPRVGAGRLIAHDETFHESPKLSDRRRRRDLGSLIRLTPAKSFPRTHSRNKARRRGWPRLEVPLAPPVFSSLLALRARRTGRASGTRRNALQQVFDRLSAPPRHSAQSIRMHPISRVWQDKCLSAYAERAHSIDRRRRAILPHGVQPMGRPNLPLTRVANRFGSARQCHCDIPIGHRQDLPK
jgi:hypothetical protein